MDNKALVNCLTVAKNAGVSRDQANQLVSMRYVPLPWQWEFHAVAREADKPDGPVDIGVGGARGPGKSHAVLAQVALDDCQRIPNLKGLFLRQTGTAAKESFDDLIEKVLSGRINYQRTTNILKFPNGSRIILGGFKTVSDIDKYIGIEYDIIIVEELNQLTSDKYLKLRGSLRTSKQNWRPRMYTSFNPGGIGHEHVKDRYIKPFREKKEKETRFIGSTYLSNPYLNKEYIQFLEGLVGDLGKAWKEGDWDIFAGKYFKSFKYDIHAIPRYVPNFRNGFLIGSMDWGRVDNFAFYVHHVFPVNFEGQMFYRIVTFLEVYGNEKTPKEWAAIIERRLEGYNLTVENLVSIMSDDQIFSKSATDVSKTIADLFNDYNPRYDGVLKTASKERVNGWEIMQNWLSMAPDGKPYWQITENCINLLRTLPIAVHDLNKVEDIDQGGEDDALDSVRYGFMDLKWIDAKAETAERSGTIKEESTTLNEDMDEFGEDVEEVFKKVI